MDDVYIKADFAVENRYNKSSLMIQIEHRERSAVGSTLLIVKTAPNLDQPLYVKGYQGLHFGTLVLHCVVGRLGLG